MYTIRRSKDFELSIKRLKHAGLKPSVKHDIECVIDLLALGEKLPAKYRDHKLQGELSAYRECHIKGDLLLIYMIRKEYMILILVDIGSHAQLF
ncbi:MAG: type II toxin-antitoxin system YafQ family toxin [Candidatus Yonathbacteria bacterium]|nr:type II toxin-antitoxin system YafQ family toxin [Candidatus Yonathbacteria bacterium]NTW47358.1 type II toxin-antitoxin system YafQ family toxin [Candidatus Yonathbacteria bacterium]